MSPGVMQRLSGTLWQACAGLSWASRAALLLEDLSDADAQEISDHADEAGEDLSGPLAVAWPAFAKIGHEAEEDARLAAASAALRLPVLDGPAIAREVVRDVMATVRMLLEDARITASELQVTDTLSASRIEDVYSGLEEATQSVDAALIALDPSHSTGVLNRTIDLDERIIVASDNERAELQRATIRETNAHFDALSRASQKLMALRRSRSTAYAQVHSRLESVTSEDVPRLLADLFDLGLDNIEARALIGMFLIGARR